MSEPEPRQKAPPPLELVQDFVNSVEMPDGEDLLATSEAASAWLEAAGSPGLHVAERDRRCLVEAREALRDVLGAHSGENVEPAVLVRLERLLGRGLLRPRLTPEGAALVCDAYGVDGFLGRLAAAIASAPAEDWARLKTCRSDACRWAFFDRSKNARGAWCSMRVCGSREKARAYRERKRRAAV